jgi:cation transporter-like permease
MCELDSSLLTHKLSAARRRTLHMTPALMSGTRLMSLIAGQLQSCKQQRAAACVRCSALVPLLVGSERVSGTMGTNRTSTLPSLHASETCTCAAPIASAADALASAAEAGAGTGGADAKASCKAAKRRGSSSAEWLEVTQWHKTWAAA